MPARRARAASGHTLLEIVVSTSIFTLVVTGALLLVRDANVLFRTALVASNLRRQGAALATSFAVELAESNPASFTIDHLLEGDRITLQLPLTCVNASVTWGGVDRTGGSAVQHANAFVQYLLVRDPAHTLLWRLVRRVVDGAGKKIGEDATVLDHVDARDARLGSGFSATRQGNLISIALRVRHADDAAGSAGSVVRVHQFTVQLRNS